MRSRGKARTLSKITVEPEPGVADTLLTAELDETHTAPTFAELNVRPEIVRALAEMGIERTFAIQELTLPLALAGEDLIGQARTGMGKTFGFGVPLLHRISTGSSGTIALDGTPRALVIVPTRELCVQVTSDLENAAKHVKAADGTPLRVTAIYGGRPYESQIEALRRGVDVVVGTPGRLLDLAEQQHLILGKVQVLVLDEADEMLDLGFLPDIERILNMVPDQRQTMLFSATMPGPIITLARTFLNRPTHIRAEEPHDSAVHDRIEQFVYRAHALDKSELIARILQAETRGATMIFARTKRTAQKVADDLAERGFAVGAVHGDLGQIAREKALKKFREGKIDVLVATDVAARGIDIDDVTHVVNYQCPEDEKTYVHRIGRTGRAGRAGVAITLVDWDELKRWASIDAALDLKIPEPVETYSRSPHLYAELGIPEGITGVLRKRKPERDDDAVVVERESRAPRDRGRRRTRGGRPLDGEAAVLETTGSPVSEGDSADEDKPGRRRRRRRRGKGAGDNTAAVTNGTAETTSNTEAAQQNPAIEDNGNEANGNTEGGRRRRRNRRGGRGQTDADGTVESRSDADATRRDEVSTTDGQAEVSTANTATASAATEAPAVIADAAVVNSEKVSAETDSITEAPRKRTRRTKGSADATNGATVAVNGAVGVQTSLFSHAPDTHAPSTATAAANGSAVTDATATAAGNGPAADDSVATTEAPRKRTRRAKTAEPASEATTDTATAPAATEAEAPRKRTRKAAAEATTGAAETADTTADLAGPAVAEAPAPRKRARRAAGAADATTVEASTEGVSAADTVDAPKAAPRKRTRSTTAAAEVVNASAEAAAPEAVAAEAAPKKRARRTAGSPDATAVATEDSATAEAPKAAPRKRTSKATADTAAASEPTVVADAGQEAAPAPRKRTRTTKAAAADTTVNGTAAVEVTAEAKAAPKKRASRAKAAEASTEAAEAVPAAPKKRTARKAATTEAAPAEPVAEKPKKRTRSKAVSAGVTADEAVAASA